MPTTTQQRREAIVNADAPAVVNRDGTPTDATVEMLQKNGRARTPAEAAIKVKQEQQRKAIKAADEQRAAADTSKRSPARPVKVAASSAPVAKAGAKAKVPVKAATSKTTAQRPAKKVQAGTTKADTVRAYLLKHADDRPVDIARATEVDQAYVWDIRQAMRRAGTLPMPAEKPTPKVVAKAPAKASPKASNVVPIRKAAARAPKAAK